MTRLIFTRKTIAHSQCIKAQSIPHGNGITWSSFFFGPEEGKTTWTEQPDAWNAILTRIARDCISNESKVYGLLASFSRDELSDILRYLQSSGTLSNAPRGLLEKIAFALNGRVILIEGTKREFPQWYKAYGGWALTPWCFVASRSRLDGWQRELRRIAREGRLSKDILDKAEIVLFNHFDHGIEVISSVFKENVFQTIAESVSEEFHIPLKIQDFGNPFGDSKGV